MIYDYDEAILECFATYVKWPTFFSLISNDQKTGDYILYPHLLNGRMSVGKTAYIPIYYRSKAILLKPEPILCGN